LILKRLLLFIVILPFVLICAVPIAFIGVVIVVPAISGWQTERSIIVVDDAKYVFSNELQFSGSYKQRSLYYQSSKPLSEIKQFYQGFTMAPFVEVYSQDNYWLIAAWKGSKINENRIGKGSPSDICAYNRPFDCMSITLFDVSQSSLLSILGSLYNSPSNEIQSLAHSGTLIVFSYYIPDYS
jgi:hypothetical protein